MNPLATQLKLDSNNSSVIRFSICAKFYITSRAHLLFKQTKFLEIMCVKNLAKYLSSEPCSNVNIISSDTSYHISSICDSISHSYYEDSSSDSEKSSLKLIMCYTHQSLIPTVVDVYRPPDIFDVRYIVRIFFYCVIYL